MIEAIANFTRVEVKELLKLVRSGQVFPTNKQGIRIFNRSTFHRTHLTSNLGSGG
jgi:hypothetical protein